MIELIKKSIVTFFLVIAGVTISAAVFVTIFFSEIELSILLLWQIILMAFVCTLGNFIYYSKYELSKRQMMIRIVIHYFYINLVVLGGAFLWEWITQGYIVQFVVMLLLIAVVYVGVTLVNFMKEEKTAEVLNKRLSKINTEEDVK